MGLRKMFRNFEERKDIERQEREQARMLQQKFDRQALAEDTRKTRAELKKLKVVEKHRGDVAAVREFKQKTRPKTKLVFGRITFDPSRVGTGIDDIFGFPKGSSTHKKKRRKKRR